MFQIYKDATVIKMELKNLPFHFLFSSSDTNSVITSMTLKKRYATTVSVEMVEESSLVQVSSMRLPFCF